MAENQLVLAFDGRLAGEAQEYGDQGTNRSWRHENERAARHDGQNWLNRRVRTRMHGGVGGGGP